MFNYNNVALVILINLLVTISNQETNNDIIFYSIIDRLQTQIVDLNLPNEDELHIQLSGLKQVRSFQ